MATHIENLAKEADKAHIRLKDSIEDVLVTRLTMNEFSLYTKDSPLSLAEYKLLIKKINGIASTLPPNIHLLLATIPVLWPDNCVHNCALYVQSPISPVEQPIIHHLSKEHASATDFYYMDKTGHPLPLQGDDYGTTYCPRIILGDTEVMNGDINQFGSALKIITAEGICFITLIDICLGHQSRVAEKNLASLLAQLKAHGLKIPLYMNQVITSHTIAPIKKNVFTSLTQADKTYQGVNGLGARETIHLLSSFGDFVDITLFPPTYLEIPYRKRVLRHLSSAVSGQTILEETVMNPGIFRFLEKRVKSLIDIGVDMNQHTQQQYQIVVERYLSYMANVLDPAEIQGDSTIPSTTDDSTVELNDPETVDWVEALLADVHAAIPFQEQEEEPMAGDSVVLPNWLESIISTDEPEEKKETSPWSSANTVQKSYVTSLIYNGNPYSLFFEGAQKQVEGIKRSPKDYSAPEAYPRFIAGTKVARSEEVENRRHCDIESKFT